MVICAGPASPRRRARARSRDVRRRVSSSAAARRSRRAGHLAGQSLSRRRGDPRSRRSDRSEGAASGTGRRAARLGGHGARAARRAVGLEAALIDNSTMTIAALDPADERSLQARVAGPAALLVAKAHKLHDRVASGRAVRLEDKDASDVVRLMQTTRPDEIAVTLNALTQDEIAGLRRPRRSPTSRSCSADVDAPVSRWRQERCEPQSPRTGYRRSASHTSPRCTLCQARGSAPPNRLAAWLRLSSSRCHTS